MGCMLIATRGRGNYGAAAVYLQRIRGAYHHLNEAESCRALIARLCEDNRRLPALQDELDKAGL